MHIHDDHRHYGSALIQIAEDAHFTSINAVHYAGSVSRCGFRINKEIGIYIKYRSKPRGKKCPLYAFSFSQENLRELRAMRKNRPRLFVALVCVKAREICCLPYNTLVRFIEARLKAKGEKEEEYTIEVSVFKNVKLRVWISEPNTRGTYIDQQLVSRNNFPRKLFEK